MELLRDAMMFLHFLGFGSLIVGCALSVRRSVAGLNRLTWIGAATQLVTGLVLTTLAELNPERDLDHAKVGVKLTVLIAIAVISVIFAKRELPRWVLPTLAGLAVVDVAVAVFW